MEALRLALQGLRRRTGVSLLLLAVAAAAVAAAAAGPMYLRAGRHSLLRDEFSQQPPQVTGLDVSAPTNGLPGAADRLLGTVRELTAGLPAYRPPVSGLERAVTVQDGSAAAGSLVYRADSCRHLVLIAGRCPGTAGEVALSDDTDRVLARPVVLGERLPISTPTGSATVTVVGRWRVPDATEPYWYGRPYFAALRGLSEGTTVDALFTVPDTFALLPEPDLDLRLRPFAGTQTVVDLTVDPDAVDLADATSWMGQLTTLEGRLVRSAPDALLRSNSEVSLQVAARTGAGLRRPVVLVVFQLLALAWFVLFTVLAGAADARGVEVALAKLRGFTPLSTVAFALLETGLVLLAALPVGLLVGYAAVLALARSVLAPHVPVDVTGGPLLAAAAALAGAALAALLAAVHVLRQPVLSLLRRTSPRRSAGRAALVDGLVLVVAGVTLRALLRRDAGVSVDALLAPGLLAVVSAVLAARLLPALCRVGFRTSREGSHVAVFLAVRQVARRTGGLRVVVVLGVALGLATFAVVGQSVFTANRDDRARVETGAERVLTVDPTRAPDLLALVRAADPTGRRAMAVLTYEGFGSPARVVGVDTQALASVSYWRADLAREGVAQVAALLRQTGPTGRVPALVGRDVPVGGSGEGTVLGAGLDGQDLLLSVAARAAVIPRFGPGATMVDLVALQARAVGPITSARAEVWLPADADDVVDRLRTGGLQVYRSELAGTRADRFGRQAPALALHLFLAGAGAAAVLALGGTVLELYLSGRRRAFEIAAMAAVGVRRSQLRKALFLEQGLVLGTGTVAGLAAGLAGVRLTLPGVPEFIDVPVYPALLLAPDPVFVVGLLTGMSLVLAGGLSCSVLLLIRSARPVRLREMQP